MRVVSWNVNGLRACANKGFAAFLAQSRAHIVAVQEVRAFREQLPPEIAAPPKWHTHFCAAQRPGYSGVGFFHRNAAEQVREGLGEARFDVEGRLLTGFWGNLAVINGYFPKGSGKDRDNSRVPYKLDFYRRVFKLMQALRAEYHVLVLGDLNTAHHELDLARPKTNRKSSGFLPEERALLDGWADAGWVDLFRAQHPDEPGHYTWWRQWGDARANNVGWRIDAIWGSPSVVPFVKRAFISPDVLGSDHCPIGVDLKPTLLHASPGS